jgi:hypothetical protein
MTRPSKIMHEYLIDKDKESKLAAEVSNLMDRN